jgi:hypothetical protein
MIARGTFLLGVLIFFSILFYIGSKLVYYFLSPSETPFLISGMKDATEALTISQHMGQKTTIPILRSVNEYGGVEFTYSFWIYINDVNYNEAIDYKHVFNKGSSPSSQGEGGSGLFGPNNAPGVYLYNGKKNYSDALMTNYPVLGMLVRLNVFHNNESVNKPYFDDIYVDAIPIKKWVGIIIRSTSQNIVDIYINGSLTKRHKLSNIVKQNYDNLYVNYKLKHNEKYDICQEFCMCKLIHYLDTVLNCTEIYIIDSCFTGIILPLLKTNKLKSKKTEIVLRQNVHNCKF